MCEPSINNCRTTWDESGDQYDGSGQRQHGAGITSPKCAAILHPVHAVPSASIGSYRQHNKRLMEAWRLLFQAYSPNNARLVVMMLEGLSFPSDTNDVINSLETMDQRLRGVREHQHSTAPQGRHRDSPDRRRTDENAPHHERPQVDDVPRHRSRSDECQASSKVR